MDWNKEVESLSVGLDFLKLESGQHKVKCLNEGELKDVTYEERTLTKLFIEVEKDGKKYMWTMAKGISLNSLYGQLALLGRKDGGLTGKEITVLVKGEGKNKDYTIIEALDLIKCETELRKKPVEEIVL